MSNRSVNKEADKLRNLSAAELAHQEREQMDQLFRLKFQMKMGQSESLIKIRGLRRSVARIKTIKRQHQLGLVNTAPAAVRNSEVAPKAATKIPAKAAVKAKAPAKAKASKSTKAGKK